VSNPEQFRFTKSHEWFSPEGRVGISDHAQKEITDVVFVELPKAGRDVKAGEAIAIVESVKAAFDIYAPVSGKIIKTNADVTKNPALVNQSPYEKGWFFEIQKTGDEDKNLMTQADYQKFLESDAH
jgi:glycine cleavage system H protein